ncbi:MAG: hypothetical protein JSS60_01380 [Verrucomicrobia bacterium]|nr:hypothetical protein [Verrucomicrobiota bacterium]
MAFLKRITGSEEVIVPIDKGAAVPAGKEVAEQGAALAYNRVKRWIGETAPCYLTYALPSGFAPTRMIPYEDLGDPRVLEKHLLPKSAHVYPTFSRIFENIRDIDDLDHCEVLRGSNQFLVFIHPQCPGYVIKMKSFFKRNSFHRHCKKAHLYGEMKDGNIYRVVMASRMRQCIQEMKLDRLHVPYKWLFSLREDSKLVDSDYAVIAAKEDLLSIDETREMIKRMPKAEGKILLRQLFLLLLMTGYQDARIDNLCFNKRGELVIHDAEPIGNVDLSRHASHAAHRLGHVREEEIDCALYGIRTAISESGLPFDPALLNEVACEFHIRAAQEKKTNAMRRKMLVAMTLFLHAAMIASVFYMSRRALSFRGDH